jgi:hypothetical protein
MLHITNGDCAVRRLQDAELPGSIMPWRDVLHEGPVPDGLDLDSLREIRARFLSDQGWGNYDDLVRELAERDSELKGFGRHEEVVLWFEHDLYDQLQLIQVLDWFAERPLEHTRLSIVCEAEYVGTMPPERCAEFFRSRRPATSEELDLGQRAWAAFRSPDPSGVEIFLGEQNGALPFLAAALTRHLQQFPSVENGLSRSEQQALEAIAAGRRVIKDVYVASHHEREDPIFLGDSTFGLYMAGMSSGPEPLILIEPGERVMAPGNHSDDFFNRRVSLTEAGAAVLEKRRDWIEINGIDRWYGGTHLKGDRAGWRWDEAARRLRQYS